jgi:signal peptidase I
MGARRRRLAVLALAVLGVIAAVALIIAVPLALVVFRTATIAGQAMAPTLRDRDRVLVDTLAYREQPPQRGDIVMLLYPPNPSRLFIKRVIGQPGERLEIRDGRVYVNGELDEEPHVPPESRSRERWGPDVIPDDHYFVMGDLRRNSSDSRHWGFVPARNIVGRVTLRWWPLSEARRY